MLKPGLGALIWISTLMVLGMSQPSMATETGPVDRKWGIGWDSGLAARYWLGGVWELGVSAGPDDYLREGDRQSYYSGYPPNWNESEEKEVYDEKRESGFVHLEAGRLLARRGPLAAVVVTGLSYHWSDSRTTTNNIDVLEPEDSFISTRDNDFSSWTLTLGLRPSFEVLDFLTIETVFWLGYSWSETDEAETRFYPEEGRLQTSVRSDKSRRFFDSYWYGTSSLQIIVWF